MAEIYLRRIGKTLLPADRSSEEILDKMPQGKVMRVEYRFPRNYAFHKKFFAMLETMFDMQEHFTEFEAFRLWLTMKSGWFEVIEAPNGYQLFRPKSIAFSKMDNEEFSRLYNKAIDTFVHEFQHISRADMDRVLEYADDH